MYFSFNPHNKKPHEIGIYYGTRLTTVEMEAQGLTWLESHKQSVINLKF